MVPTTPGGPIAPMSNGTNYGQPPMGSGSQPTQAIHPQLNPGAQSIYGSNGPAMMSKGPSYQGMNGIPPGNPMPSVVPNANVSGMSVQAAVSNPANIAVPNSNNPATSSSTTGTTTKGYVFF